MQNTQQDRLYELYMQYDESRIQNTKEDRLYKLYIDMQRATDGDEIHEIANKIERILSPGLFSTNKYVFKFAPGTQVAMQKVLYEDTCMDMNDTNIDRGFVQTVIRNRPGNNIFPHQFTSNHWSWSYLHYDLPMTLAVNLYGHYSETLYKYYYGDYVQPPFEDIYDQDEYEDEDEDEEY